MLRHARRAGAATGEGRNIEECRARRVAGRGFPRRALLGWAAAGVAAVPAARGIAARAARCRAGSGTGVSRERGWGRRSASTAAGVRVRENGPPASVAEQGIGVRGIAVPGIAAPNFDARNFAAANLGAANLATTNLDRRGLGTSSLHAHNVVPDPTATRRGRTGAALLAAANAHPAAVAGTQAATAPAASARNSANVASWTPAEPAIQIAIPAAAMFPPGAVPDGLTFIADVTIAADGSAQRLRLRP